MQNYGFISDRHLACLWQHDLEHRMAYSAKSWEGGLVGGLFRWNRPLQPTLVPGKSWEKSKFWQSAGGGVSPQ